MVAAVLGGLPAKEALDRAHEHFLGIDFADLTYEDFASNNNQGNTTARSADLRSRTQRCKLGSVDVFLSCAEIEPRSSRDRAEIEPR